MAAGGPTAGPRAADRPAAQHGEGTDAMTRGVVLHLSEGSPDKHRAVLRNALNLLPVLEPGTPVEVVVHGDGLALALTGAPAGAALAEAQAAGIRLAVCRNSMRSAGVDDDRLAPGAFVVPSGVAHLVARQFEGWAYLRP